MTHDPPITGSIGSSTTLQCTKCLSFQMYYLFIFLYFRKVKVVLTLDSRAMENIFVGRQKSKRGGESVRITYIYIHTRLLFPPQRGFSGTIMLATLYEQ